MYGENKNLKKGDKMSQKIGKPVTFIIPVELKEECERIADKRNMSTSAVYRMMLDLGTNCHRDMEKVGIIAAVDFAYFVRKSVKEKSLSAGFKQMNLI